MTANHNIRFLNGTEGNFVYDAGRADEHVLATL